MRYFISNNGDNLVAIFDILNTYGPIELGWSFLATNAGTEDVYRDNGDRFRLESHGRWANIYHAPSENQVLQRGSRVWASREEAESHNRSSTMRWLGAARLYSPIIVAEPVAPPAPRPIPNNFNRRWSGNGLTVRLGKRWGNIYLEIEGSCDLLDARLAEIANRFGGGGNFNTSFSDLLRRNRYRHRCQQLHVRGVTTMEAAADLETQVRQVLGQRVANNRTSSFIAPSWASTIHYGCTSPDVVIDAMGDTSDFEGGGIGLEFEIERCSMSARKRVAYSNAITENCHVEFKRDGSLTRGIELCPQPFTSFSAALKRMEGAWRHLPPTIRNAIGPVAAENSMAGTHIHVSGSNHADLPPRWWTLESEVIDLVSNNWDFFKKLGQFSDSQASYKRAVKGSRGWWNCKNSKHVEFRGFGLCRDGIDLANYIAIIKAVLWTTHIIENNGVVAQGDGYTLRLFLKKLVRLGWVNRFGIELPKVSFDHDDFLDHEGYLRVPHHIHGKVLGKVKAEALRLKRITHTCALPPDEWVTATSIDDFKIGQRVKLRNLETYQDWVDASEGFHNPSGESSMPSIRGRTGTVSKVFEDSVGVLLDDYAGADVSPSWNYSVGWLMVRAEETSVNPSAETTIKSEEIPSSFNATMTEEEALRTAVTVTRNMMANGNFNRTSWYNTVTRIPHLTHHNIRSFPELNSANYTEHDLNRFMNDAVYSAANRYRDECARTTDMEKLKFFAHVTRDLSNIGDVLSLRDAYPTANLLDDLCATWRDVTPRAA